MKRTFKPIILASAAALAFGAVAVGTTFALFTSKSTSTINVQSGIVNVESSSQLVSVTELNNVAVLPDAQGVYTNSIGGKTYVDPDNSNIVHLEKWAPGDSATIEFRNINKSNVAIRSRFTTNHTSTSDPDLYSALTYTVQAFDKDDNPIADPSLWATYAAAEDIDDGYLLSRVVLTISFPNHDEDGSYDNQYQDANCTFYFTQETVQGNAYTPNTNSIGF